MVCILNPYEAVLAPEFYKLGLPNPDHIECRLLVQPLELRDLGRYTLRKVIAVEFIFYEYGLPHYRGVTIQ